ncbi:helix-turn-helix transcriptional regulator [Phaeobacter gallaeciensis]|jgi:DNA-binding CsgD family transcriptional regulator|uniref:helix-turn-helix transcriptional regulator n=1 Tax=Phaeobacter gallaeciensis TaxID=60890 RepID=UPI00237F16A0|nr:helix-turn-helix transcriptional regulator [Phaeobacter gallaeciensis]MDE4098329.1 helix-turn-helix transcriptional regulator [Phaeobacter gallaeciensis]MDE4107139.1 helix-turn-helix transcriptional regulator [Phaeobacter gallaeciensis]MDE4111402.1 helix-turn-helix transcriptional regulator [Phaeobacter gallaeciensis]MDE4116064.1 helix-turn-helix transcriptional regulator [Phaeobacter gallaeciensis]MDE4120343.1 helix-turn-helix transcriptional regulator [Phaeobacter gallaeciensis]
MKTGWFLPVLVLVQGICATFFVSDIALTVLGLRSRPISWQTREFLEIGAALGLVLGVVLGWIAYRRSQQRVRAVEESLRLMQSAFKDHLEERFCAWGLTPAERDVALFSLKGLSLSEIAELRQTSDGTVKAQSNAIYRKAGVSGRTQLLSLFIEDLMSDDD